jgi:hypothetical protein
MRKRERSPDLDNLFWENLVHSGEVITTTDQRSYAPSTVQSCSMLSSFAWQIMLGSQIDS